MQLNVGKTKELLDLRRIKTPVNPVSIQEVSVDIVVDCKYLGVNIDSKLDWEKKTMKHSTGRASAVSIF